MSFVLFYIVFACCWLLALLPMKILYLLSDLIFLFSYHVFSYRKKVVMRNLRNAFHEKTETELITLAKKFYRHFYDVIFETLKLIHFSPEKLSQKIRLKNPELLEDLYQKKKSVIAVIGHYNNWEWILGINHLIPHHTLAIYKPLNNKYFNKYIIKLRSRFGVELIPMRRTLKTMLEYSSNGRLILTGFLSDQSPVWEEVQYWTSFLNQQTPVYLGIEKMAKKTGQVVVFFYEKKIRRGNYEVEVIKLFDNPTGTSPYQITEKHLRLLEEIITAQPEYWLWTHRRWKLTPRRLKQLEGAREGWSEGAREGQSD
jgi:KDO2-lipid IV(A) lauroyltransferase